jgi:hypothetical protein
LNRFKCKYNPRYLVLGENLMECHFWWFEIQDIIVSCFCKFFAIYGFLVFARFLCFWGFFLMFGLGFLCVYKWDLSWFRCGVPFQGVSVLCVVSVMIIIVVGIDINVHDIEKVWLNLFKILLRSHDTPLSSLIDSTTSPKVKTTEE